jgi:hypothetical protein
MSRNGSGTYTLPAGNPVVTGTTISSTWANSTLTNIASALTDSLAADGQTTATGNLKMGNNRITGLADGIASTDAATVNQIPSGALFLLKASNLSDVANATTARGNLTAAESGANSDITSLTGLTTPLTVAQGGTGAATLTANNVLLGNGTSAPQVVAPSTTGNVLTSNGTTWTSAAPAAYPLTSGTDVASTSGTSIDFTSIPSWVKRITVMLNGVSTNGTSVPLLRLGTSDGIESTSYAGSETACVGVNAGSYTKSISTGFDAAYDWGSSETIAGQYIVSLVGSNVWVCTWSFGHTNGSRTQFGGGNKTLSGTLDRIRFTTSNGTDTFDAGSINILYE